MKKNEQAENLFEQGANCAQAVLGAFAEECGLSRNEAFKIASGFGAGFGRMREVCGAVSGMVLVLNYLYGNENIQDKEAKDTHYKLIQKLLQDFQKEAGSIICRELLQVNKEKHQESFSAVSEARTPEYYKKRPCGKMVALAAGLVEDFLQKNQ